MLNKLRSAFQMGLDAIGLSRSRWTPWVAYRFLRSKNRSQFLSFITFISIGGLGIGVSALIVVLSVMDGFETQLKKRLMATDLHLMILPKNRERVPVDALKSSPLQPILNGSKHLLRITSVTQIEGIVRSEKKMSGLILKGIDDVALGHLKEKLVESRSIGTSESGFSQEEGLYPIYLGQELAYDLGVIPGDTVTLISPTEMDGPFSNIPRMKKYTVEGVFRLGLPDLEMHQAFLPQKAIWSFIREKEVASHYEVVMNDLESAESLRERLESVGSDFESKDWIQMNAHLFASLKLERFGMFLGLLFIVVVASFNIVTTLTLMVMEKKRDISILKAMGARDREVGSIFLYEGVFIGFWGVFAGTSLGLLICFLLKRYEFITLPEVYFDRTLPVSFLPGYYIGIAVVTFLVVLIASVYPSLRAAKITPIQGIR
jgi:lipoprotein-releasing system permease protein